MTDVAAAKSSTPARSERQPLSPANRDPTELKQPGKLPHKQPPPFKSTRGREAAGKLDVAEGVPAFALLPANKEDQAEVRFQLLSPCCFYLCPTYTYSIPD